MPKVEYRYDSENNGAIKMKYGEASEVSGGYKKKFIWYFQNCLDWPEKRNFYNEIEKQRQSTIYISQQVCEVSCHCQIIDIRH